MTQEAGQFSGPVPDYYDQATSCFFGSLREDLLQQFLTFAPFPEAVEGFSWILTFMEPQEHRAHFEQMLARQQEMRKQLFSGIDFAKVKRAFDLGCGYASDLIILALEHTHLQAQGFTLSAAQIDYARARIVRYQVQDRVQVYCQDSASREFPQRYQLIFGIEVLHHTRNKEALFSNVARHLDDRGHLLLADTLSNTSFPIHLNKTGAFSETVSGYSSLLAGNGLAITECIDASREIANFLVDPSFEEHLDYLQHTYPAMQPLEAIHRGWDNFGLALRRRMARYLLLKIRKVLPNTDESALKTRNQQAIDQAAHYSPPTL